MKDTSGKKQKTNSKLQFFNIELQGLRGRSHPALNHIVTTHQVQRSRIHLKMLVGDYYTYEVKANQSGGSSHCRSCSNFSASETIEHMIAHCEAYQNIRERIIQEFEALCSKSKNGLSLKSIVSDPTALTQFVLDPSSFNLPQRININDPILVDMFKLSRDFCYAVHAERKRLMQ